MRADGVRVRINRARLASCAAIVLAAIWLGGVPEVIGLFAAASLLADGLVPVSRGFIADPDAHFNRLVRRRRDRWLRRLDQLDVLEISKGWTATAQRRDLGVQAIAIESIGDGRNRQGTPLRPRAPARPSVRDALEAPLAGVWARRPGTPCGRLSHRRHALAARRAPPGVGASPSGNADDRRRGHRTRAPTPARLVAITTPRTVADLGAGARFACPHSP
jgi:hypothetical protein